MNWAEPLNTIAAPLMIDNIDTDQIIPSREMKTISKKGLKSGLFANWQYCYSEGKKIGLNNNFILNKNEFRRTEILISGKNFGCGSSREHAVWALKDFGIEAIISSSFADIFHRNSFKNSLLLICVSKDDIKVILDDIADSDKYELTIDIQSQTINTPNDKVYSFDINPSDKERIILGYDDIGLTLKHSDKIKEYETKMKIKKPWIFEDNHE